MGLAQMSCGSEVDQKKYTQSCNLPIQGQCADAAMGAFIRVVHRLKEAGIPGGPVLWLHDEIVLEVPIEFAEQSRLLLDQAMTTAFAGVFPGAPLRGLVAARIGDTWDATKKKEVKNANRSIQPHPRTDPPNGSSVHADPPQADMKPCRLGTSTSNGITSCDRPPLFSG